MTVIAAIATENQVIMGCDTATDHGGTSIYSARGKIGVINASNGERILIGVAGNSAIGPTLDRCLTIESTPDDRDNASDADRWASALAEAITHVLAEANPPLLAQFSDSANGLDGSLLVAWRRHLWLVCAHAAIRPDNGIAAIGSGKDLALGSLHTSGPNGLVHPEVAVSYAIGLACAYDSGCGVDGRGPIVHSTVETVTETDRRAVA
jgi:ATP-dependent protease HslVU (ClpYQ) peptidase subunit